MGIYIKGMEMPKNCHDCEMSALVDVSDGLAYGCQALKEMIFNDRERLPDCPLIELPPHGDLIDRNELLADVRQSVVFSHRPSIGEMQLACEELRGANKIIDRIKVAPIVVESEDG